MPGYCDTIAPALLADCTNVSVSYSPEFIAQGAIIAGTLAPDMVLIGEGSTEAGDHIEALTLAYVTDPNVPVHRMSPGSAEIAKLSLNSFITLKIAFANFVGDLADSAEVARKRAAPSDAERDNKRHRIDKMHIARAIGADSRVGLKCLLPGYGFGGPCFPRDGRALAAYASQVATAGCPLEAQIAEAPQRANAAHARMHRRSQTTVARCGCMRRQPNTRTQRRGSTHEEAERSRRRGRHGSLTAAYALGCARGQASKHAGSCWRRTRRWRAAPPASRSSSTM
jgi:UDPglucose 6-dehydrogenase